MCKFNELRNKEVINVANGKRLGFVCDVDISLSDGRIISIILPPQKSNIFSFGKEEDTVIEWNKIKKIGDDIIIVDFSD